VYKNSGLNLNPDWLRNRKTVQNVAQLSDYNKRKYRKYDIFKLLVFLVKN